MSSTVILRHTICLESINPFIKCIIYQLEVFIISLMHYNAVMHNLISVFHYTLSACPFISVQCFFFSTKARENKLLFSSRFLEKKLSGQWVFFTPVPVSEQNRTELY